MRPTPNVVLASDRINQQDRIDKNMNNVLIVEDDLMIADCLEEILLEAGYDVCGIAGTVAEAVELGLRHKPDLAVIDLCLPDGGHGTEVAMALRRLGALGVLYVTGTPNHPALNAAQGEGLLTKPYSARNVVAALRIVGDLAAGVPASRAFPREFRLLGAAT